MNRDIFSLQLLAQRNEPDDTFHKFCVELINELREVTLHEDKDVSVRILETSNSELEDIADSIKVVINAYDE